MKKVFMLTARTKTQTLILVFPLTGYGLAHALDQLLLQFDGNETPEIEDIQTVDNCYFA